MSKESIASELCDITGQDIQTDFGQEPIVAGRSRALRVVVGTEYQG
jgi:hypothetical protein